MPSSGASAPGRWPIAVESAVLAACAYLIAGVLELGLIQLFQPSEIELTWVSDALLASALGVTVYLWRHLRTTRLQLAASERSQLVLETQLAIAADMQRRLLPVLPSASGELAWAAKLEPAGRIGGDFYDIVRLGNGRWLLLVADVSGKGVPAAMALSAVRAAFRSIAAESPEPARVLTQLSARLFEQWAGDPYLTAIVALVDAHRGLISYANAGHPSGIVAGRDDTRLLEATGPAAALLPAAPYDRQQIAMRPGDVAVFVSDGVTEGLGDGGTATFHRLVRGLAAQGASADEACARVMAAARAGSGPAGVADWQDDRTVVAVAMIGQAVAPGEPAISEVLDYAAVATAGRAVAR